MAKKILARAGSTTSVVTLIIRGCRAPIRRL